MTARDQASIRWLCLSLVSLPYMVYLGLAGLVLFMIQTIRQYHRAVFTVLWRQGFLFYSGLLVFSTFFAFNRGEAWLQLVHFIPFFLFFGTLVVRIRTLPTLAKLAFYLVVGSIPINLLAVLEYVFRTPTIEAQLAHQSWISWLYLISYGHRAQAVFGHPNNLANYLVIILGLGLGLLLYEAALTQRPPAADPVTGVWSTHTLFRGTGILYISLGMTLVGIFCSGSRNGIITAIAQLLLFTLLARHNRWVLFTALGSLAAIVISALFFSVGGRQTVIGGLIGYDSSDLVNGSQIIVQQILANPRIGVWRIALDLIHQRPWIGWGLGNYKFLYPSYSVDPEYPYIFHPHNIWVLLAVEVGLPLMLLLTVLIGRLCYRSTRTFLTQKPYSAEWSLSLGYLLACCGTVLFALVDITFADARVNVANWFVLAGLYIASRPALSSAPSGSGLRSK